MPKTLLSDSFAPPKRGIIFSDIDGTFWNESYQHPFSEEYLEIVFSRYEIIFVSSRTIEEMLMFQHSIGYRTTFIAENGSVIVFYANASRNIPKERESNIAITQPPGFYPIMVAGEHLLLHPLGREVIDVLPFVQFAMTETGIYAEHSWEMPLSTLAHIGNYGMDDAQRAQVRKFSVAIFIEALNIEQRRHLVTSLKQYQCQVSSGGKWMIVTREADKGSAVRWYREWLRRQNNDYPIVAGIGNEENDATMLHSVDMPFVVRNPNGYSPALADIPHSTFLQNEGTFGWGEMINILGTLH